MATFVCRVQFLDDTDPFNSTNFPEPTRPPHYTFREDIPLINQIAGVHRLLKAPQKLDDCALQFSHSGTYLDLESTLAEQRDDLEGFQEDGGRGKKHSIILRTQLSVRVHACIEKLYNSTGRELRRALFSLKQIFQDDKDLVQEFVVAEGLSCLIKVGAEADQNYQNYILRALGQIMLYVDGMNGLIEHNETVQWLYTLIGSKFRLVVKTALKLLLVFVEYTESNAALLIQAVNTVDSKRGHKAWSNAMEILEEKDGVDTELLVYAMTLINKTLAGLPDQDSFYDVVDSLEDQGIEALAQKHLNRKGTDLDLVEQISIYEMVLRHEDGDDETPPPQAGRKARRRASVGATPERRGLERRRSRRHSLQHSKSHSSAPPSPSSTSDWSSNTSGLLPFNGRRIENLSEREEEVEEEDEGQQDTERSRNTKSSRKATARMTVARASRDEASSLCLSFKCMASLIPNAAESESGGEPQGRRGDEVVRAVPVLSPPTSPCGGPRPWPCARSHGGFSQCSSVTSSTSTSPSEEPLSPFPLSSPSSCPSNSDEQPPGASQGGRGAAPDKIDSLSDVKYLPTRSATCASRATVISRQNGHGSVSLGKSNGVASAQPTPHPCNRLASTGATPAEAKPERPALGGLLTSSYRQHQESLAAERERRRTEREERLQKIEREERNRFNRDYADKREEVRQAREERYRQVERTASEEYERDRTRVLPRGRTEITLNLSPRPSSSSTSRSVTPVEHQDNTHTHSVQVTKPEPHLNKQTAVESFPVTTSASPFKPVKEQSPRERDGTSAPPPQTEAEPLSEKPVNGQEEEEAETGTEAEIEGEEGGGECENEQMIEGDVEECTTLSEKERQNEELNEKDNCSASSVSSASSTLEREEREEKVMGGSDTGPWAECITDASVNEQCGKVLNSKHFTLDMLYVQNQKPGEEQEKEEETERKKEKEEKALPCPGQESALGSLASRISTLEARRHACEENVKKMEVDHLDNQGSVRAVAEKFGDLVKGLVSPHEMEHLEKEKLQQPERVTPAPLPVPPKKESDYIWDQLLAVPRQLRIKEMDFTDLSEEDDVDILNVGDVIGPGDLTPPPPPPPCLPTFPPPPPLFGCPPPPPIPGMMPPPPPFAPMSPPHVGSPQLARGDTPLFQKKKKTIRLFWNEVRPTDWQCQNHKRSRDSLWSKLEPVKLDTAKLEHLFETKCKELPVAKKTAADGKRQEVIVLDSKRSNAINIGLTVLPPPRTIKTAILNFDEYALNKEGIEKILTMIPTEEEKQKIQEAQLANPDTPLGSAEQFLLTLSSISELSARLQLWAFKMDYEFMEKEVAEPLQDLKEGMDQLEKNKTLRCILSTLLAIGNFLNGSNAKGFELSYLEKVPEVKDTVHKQSLLHHVCSIVVEKFPDSSDLYSEIGAFTRSAKVDFDQLQENLCQMERRWKASWDHLKVIAKHEMKAALKQRMSDFLKDCAERIIVLKIIHRRIINRFHAFLLFLGHPAYAVREVSIHRFSKIISEFALEYRTTRERILQQKQKRASHRERNKTRGKLITDSDDEEDGQSGKFAGTPSDGQDRPAQGLGYTEDAAEHEHMTAVLRRSLQGEDSPSTSFVPGHRSRTRPNRGRQGLWLSANDDTVNGTDDTADDIMERIVRSATQGPGQRTQPRERKRSRANRKSLRRTLKSALSPEEAQALGLATGSEVHV
ncbi:FH1/FH2 domain-containing protein 3 [Chanos chanos]|uniref:FH1/FH2 domain-containing protein 3 n=1 Tax=Chanos chanos TaxID=29144 RepID=A0A6J2W1C3_CHACN|nr:FH1/FH2 domain-containing protein 3-like [Chanos chanos]